MLTLNVHLRQDLGEWTLVGVLVEDHGPGVERFESRTVWKAPLTASEWDGDPLSAVLSALRRWSDLTSDQHAENRQA